MRTSRTSAPILFLPFAGAHRNSYVLLQQRLEMEGVASYALELPGHGARYGEPLCRSIDEMCEDLSRQLEAFAREKRHPLNGERLVLAGHSMGAVLAWQLAVRLHASSCCVSGIFLSGRGGPETPRRRENLHGLPYERFIEQLTALGGCPPEVAENLELMELLEPVLRADFQVVETLPDLPVVPLSIPVRLLIGEEDRVTREDAEAWSAITDGDFQYSVQPGGHFHLFENLENTVDHFLRFLHHVEERTVAL